MCSDYDNSCLNGPLFQSDDDECSKIKELKLELFRFCTRRFTNLVGVNHVEDLDDLLFGTMEHNNPFYVKPPIKAST